MLAPTMIPMLVTTLAVLQISEEVTTVTRETTGMSWNGKLPSVSALLSFLMQACIDALLADLKRAEGGAKGSDSEDDRPKKKKPATNGKPKQPAANGKSKGRR